MKLPKHAEQTLRDRCLENGLPYNKSLLKKLEASMPTLARFSRKYLVSLIEVDVTAENTRNRVIVEPMFYFSNNSRGENFGGYTLRGLRNSLSA
jgi:hypothetical protein